MIRIIKKNLKRLLFYIKQPLCYSYKFLLYLKFIAPKIIIRVDGGICSQMHQYMLGCIFREKGYKVSYDLSFYKHWAKDNYGNFERKFDLLKAFPNLDFKQSSAMENMVYSIHFADTAVYLDHVGDDVFLYDLNPPKYLGGYYRCPKEVWLKLFPKYFYINHNVFDNANYSLYEEIKNKTHTVGVHVRRGDLKDFNAAYGYPADFDYFNKAVSYINKKTETPFFYFFSDESQWVRDELIGKLSIENTQYLIVNENGSDKGYMDLFLIACCTHQITSKGSLGKYGALLGDSKDKIVVLCDDPTEYVWKERFQNPVYL